MIKPMQIVIAAVTIHPLLIKRLDNNAKLPIRTSDLAAGIDIMANQDIIILPGQCFPVNIGKNSSARRPSSKKWDRHRARSYR
jgi:dUTPase